MSPAPFLLTETSCMRIFWAPCRSMALVNSDWASDESSVKITQDWGLSCGSLYCVPTAVTINCAHGLQGLPTSSCLPPACFIMLGLCSNKETMHTMSGHSQTWFGRLSGLGTTRQIKRHKVSTDDDTINKWNRPRPHTLSCRNKHNIS